MQRTRGIRASLAASRRRRQDEQAVKLALETTARVERNRGFAEGRDARDREYSEVVQPTRIGSTVHFVVVGSTPTKDRILVPLPVDLTRSVRAKAAFRLKRHEEEVTISSAVTMSGKEETVRLVTFVWDFEGV